MQQAQLLISIRLGSYIKDVTNINFIDSITLTHAVCSLFTDTTLRQKSNFFQTLFCEAPFKTAGVCFTSSWVSNILAYLSTLFLGETTGDPMWPSGKALGW